MNPELMEIVVWTVVFLDTCDDDAVDPDVAVNQLEWIAATLQRLGKDERAALLSFVETELGKEAAGPNRPDVMASLEAFAENAGLLEADE